MAINSKKTKEMILGTASKSPPPLLTISNSPVERVTCFKLLGINICNDLGWDVHVDALCSKVASMWECSSAETSVNHYDVPTRRSKKC